MARRVLVALCGLALIPVASANTAERIKTICDTLPNKTIVIGMVTKGNVELTLQRWRPTFDDYLNRELQALGYDCRTKLVPLGFDNYEEKTRNKEIDIIFPNPTAFQEMKDMYGVHEFLSVTRTFGENQRLDRFGGVIVRSSTRFHDVIEIGDMKNYPGIKVCAVNPNAFGGWHIQWYEMIKHGIDVSTDVELKFTGKHERAIEWTVVSKECDVGVARTETVERLISQGVFNESDVFTLSEKGPANDFPQRLSTELYPEWPLASLAHLPREIEQIIAVPLLTIKPDSVEASLGDFYGFSFPYSYQPVKDMFIAIDKAGTGQCYPGSYREGSNPGTCEPCPAGSFSHAGLGACSPCPVGTVNNGTGNVDCSFCPAGLTTEKEGSAEGSCVEPPEVEEVPWEIIVIIVSCLVLLLLLVPAAMGARRLYRQYQEALRASREEEENKRKRLRSAVNFMQNFEFPLCVMRFTDFMREECLVAHEKARNQGILKWLDRWDEATQFAKKNAIVFNSHQWLAIDRPDPNHTHFKSMVQAGKQICEEYDLKHEELWIWVDFSCIPQACDASKFCAIRSIMVYASCCKYFVAVVPDAVHVTRGHPCDEHTYRRRGWCRLEQWSFMINGGVDNMFVFDGNNELTKVNDKYGWFEDMINVLDGDFSVDSDKHMLVDVILGLYGFALICDRDAMQEGGVVMKASTNSVELAVQYRDVAFPRKYFNGLNDRLEKEVENVFQKGGDILWSQDELDSLFQASKAFTEIHSSVERSFTSVKPRADSFTTVAAKPKPTPELPGEVPAAVETPADADAVETPEAPGGEKPPPAPVNEPPCEPPVLRELAASQEDKPGNDVPGSAA